MSYARIVKPIKARVGNVGTCTIPKGSEVSHVRLEDGAYTFKVRIAGTAGAVVVATTYEDLPAHTDKGIEQRKHFPNGLGTLGRGRPRLGTLKEETSTKHVSVKLRVDQHQWIERFAKEHDKKISDFVRDTLISSGMPA